MTKRIRSDLPRRKEFWSTWGMVILLTIALIAAVMLKHCTQPTYSTTTHTVAPGDTLYSIAAQNCPQEPRDATIAEIEALNPGITANIQPGQRIKVPVEVSRGSERTLTMTATAYCETGATKSGLPAGPGIVAVDPRVIPLGSLVYVEGYGQAIAADTGRLIKGNKIDLWMPDREQCLEFGRRTVEVTIIGEVEN